MKPKTDIKKVAKFAILRLIQNGQTICPLKLQKILYYIQAWHMVYFERENTLFSEIPEAWVNGPVYRTIYDEYKKIGIYDQITLDDISSTRDNLEEDIKNAHDELKLEEDQFNFLEAIFLHYGTMSHDQLVYLTHSEKPWNTAREGLSPIEYSNKNISLDEMKDYYKSLSQKTK